MIILDDLEKLISEHGSSSILRDRIAFIGDQFSALEKEKANVEKECARLREQLAAVTAEKEGFKINNEALKLKIAELEAIIRKYDADRDKVREQHEKEFLQGIGKAFSR